MKIKCRMKVEDAKMYIIPEIGTVFYIDPLLIDDEKAIVDENEQDKRSLKDLSNAQFYCKGMSIMKLESYSLLKVEIETGDVKLLPIGISATYYVSSITALK